MDFTSFIEELVAGTLLLFLFFIVLLQAMYFSDEIRRIKMIIRLIRTLVGLEILFLLPLLYFEVFFGPPFNTNVITSYGDGDSWIYGYGRPVAGIILIGFGMLSNMHYIIRYICYFGSLAEVAFDIISALQVRNYQISTQTKSAPMGKYSYNAYSVYILRDLVSMCTCALITMMMSYLTYSLGYSKQKFPFWKTEGGELDRAEMMRTELTKRFDN
jgi:hypothetical protein